MQSPEKGAKAFISFVIGSTIFSDYFEYSKQYHANPGSWMGVIYGTALAPQQYRIGVLRVANLLRHGPVGLRHTLTLIDFLGASIAAYLLFSLLERSQVFREADERARWFGAAAFVLLLQYYFSWITWYQKPETMTNAAMIAVTLWLLTVPLPFRKSVSNLVTAGAMLVIAGMQGFIRADVLFVLHLGILFVCLLPIGNGFSLPRRFQAATSAGAVLLAGGVQFYVMHRMYPHAVYETSVFQIALNLKLPIRWIPFVLFMMPSGWLVATLRRRHFAGLGSQNSALLVAAALYFGLWSLVGKIDEVRIFLPYAVALIPMTCVYAMVRFLPPADQAAR